MPSVSKSQQRLMGMAYAVKSGDMELSDIDPAYRDKVKSLSDGMTKKDLKKYAATKHDGLPETVTESISVNEDLGLIEQIIFMIIVAANVYDGSIGKPIIKYFKNRKEIKKIVKKVSTNKDLVAAAKSKDDSKFYELLRDTLTDDEFDTLFKAGANYDKVQRGVARESVSEAFIGPYVFNDKMSDEELKAMYFSALDGYAYYQKGMHYAKSDYKKAYQEIEKILKKRGVAVDEDFAHAAQHITPSANIGGMGPVVLPGQGKPGSGDVPSVADIDDDEEEAKKDKTKKKLEMENFKLFTQFSDFVNEATDYNDPVLIRLRQDKLRKADMAKLDAMKKEAEKNRKKAMKRWNQKKYDQWLEDVAANDGWKNAYDMAQNAEFEPGLVDWIEKEFPYDDPMQRIQWDIEAFAESVVNEKKLDRDDMIKWIEKYMDFVRTTEEFNGSQGGIWVSGENGDEYKGRVIYDYYSEDYKNRTFGVDNKWEKELNKRGWYSEWHDAGTSMIWPL
jgi:hypothetical protein